LAELRVNEQKGKTTEQDYKVPSKGWFHFVSCPHYLAEILIYLSFAPVLYSSKNYGSHKAAALVLWVATNLTVSAIKSHDWYLLQYPEYALLRRKAIVPFLF
jgi:3-oxo-5-alpha-steroid 4-dehydrogenase 3